VLGMFDVVGLLCFSVFVVYIVVKVLWWCVKKLR
jgi:hypothetical protein